MGMTIETAIRILRGTYNSYNDVNAAAYVGLCEEENDALKIALETMQKYQKIVQIMNVGKNSNNTNIVDTWLYENISKVLSEQGELEDGNDSK